MRTYVGEVIRVPRGHNTTTPTAPTTASPASATGFRLPTDLSDHGNQRVAGLASRLALGQ